MNYQKDAEYRLKLARGFLKEAEEDFKLSRWRSCVDNAQLSAENSGKAVISIFKPLEKTHDPSSQLKGLISKEIINGEIKKNVEIMVPLFSKLGVEEHFLSDYGDESTMKAPWEIFKKEDALEALNIARKCFNIVNKIYKYYFRK